jgi:hypothetical protein
MLWWRTKPAADEYVDISDRSRQLAIREATYQAEADALSRVVRVSGKPGQKGRLLTAPFFRVRSSDVR